MVRSSRVRAGKRRSQRMVRNWAGTFCTALLLAGMLCHFPLQAAPAAEGDNPPAKDSNESSKQRSAGKDSNAHTTSAKAQESASAGAEWLDGFRLFGLVRFRPEAKYNYNFDRSDLSCSKVAGQPEVCRAQDDNVEFVGSKIQLGFEKTWKNRVTARVLLQDARVFGGETGSATGLNTANSATNQSLDVREGWVELKALLGPIDFQLGRMVLSYGDQRLVGGLDWTNVGRSFDGLRLKYEGKTFSSHLWGTVLAEQDSDAVGNDSSVGVSRGSIDDAYFVGFYNTLKLSDHFWLEGYYLGRYLKWVQRSQPSANPTVALAQGVPVLIVNSQDRSRERDNLHTFGARITNRTLDGGKKAPTAFDWSVEYAYQNGFTGNRAAPAWDVGQEIVGLPAPLYDATYNPCDVYQTKTVGGTKESGCRLYTEKVRYDAYAYAGTAGYTFSRYRVGVEYAAASGDPNRNDGAVATFNNLFHTNHIHYGQADLVSWQNMRGRSINLAIDFKEGGKLKLAYWTVDKFVLQDGWYKVTGGGAGGARSTTTESAGNARFGPEYNSTTGALTSSSVSELRKHLFKEYDISYELTSGPVTWSFAYSLFIAGDANRNALDGAGYQAQLNLYKQAVLGKTNLADYNYLDYTPTSDPRGHYASVMMTYKF